MQETLTTGADRAAIMLRQPPRARFSTFWRHVPLALALAAACHGAAGDGPVGAWPPPDDAVKVAEPGVPLGAIAEEARVPLPAAVSGPTPRTLAEFVALAERSHPKLRAALAAVEAARGKAVQARLYPNPMLAGGSPQIAGAASQWNGFASQDIVTAGKLRLAQQTALRDVQKAEYELIRARFDVLREVRQSYYALLVSQRRMEIYRLLLDIAKRSYEIGRQLTAAGEGTKADVLFWSIERDRADVRLMNAAVFIETGRRQLAAAVGLPRADVGTIEGDLLQRLPIFDLKRLQEEVVRRHARPRAAEAAVAGSQWALERAVVEPIPDVNLLGGYQRQVDFPPQQQGLLQVMVEVPLFDRNQGNIRAARAGIASARADLRMTELDLATQAAQAVAAYRTTQRMAEWYEQYILPKARETVAITQQLYARGEVTFLSLLQAQRILTETELAFVEAQADRWNAAVAIADLLQLEQFPMTADAPAAVAAPPEAVPAPPAGLAPPPLPLPPP